MELSKVYPNIDMQQTGSRLKRYIDDAGLSVKDIQHYLHLSCPQPIYRWIKGKILPSVNHLLMMSELFGVHMEDLLVKKQMESVSPEIWRQEKSEFENRIIAYRSKFRKLVA